MHNLSTKRRNWTGAAKFPRTKRCRSVREIAERRQPLHALAEERIAELQQELAERKRTEEELSYQCSLLKAQAEASRDGLMVADDKGRIILHNRHFAEIWRIPGEILQAGSDEKAMQYVRDQMVNAHEFAGRVNYFSEHKDETSEDVIGLTEGRFFERYSAPVLDESGRYFGRIWYFRDISEKKRAEASLRTYAGQMQALYARLVEVSENERRFLARELHDEIGQSLTGLKLTLDMMDRSISGDASKELQKLKELAGELLSRVRNLSLDLRPSLLDDFGLRSALEWHFKRYTSQTGIEVRFSHDGAGKRFPGMIETVAYRIVQEALTNIARHAGVREASVRISEDRGALFISIADEGTGFDQEEILSRGKTLGLIGMRERVEAVNGRLVVSSAPGMGTTLTAAIPLPPEGAKGDDHVRDDDRTGG